MATSSAATMDSEMAAVFPVLDLSTPMYRSAPGGRTMHPIASLQGYPGWQPAQIIRRNIVGIKEIDNLRPGLKIAIFTLIAGGSPLIQDCFTNPEVRIADFIGQINCQVIHYFIAQLGIIVA